MSRSRFPVDVQQFLLEMGRRPHMRFDAIAREAVRIFGQRAPSSHAIATFICLRYRNSPILDRFHRDREVAAYVLEMSATAAIDEVRAACLDRFGAPRTPSRTRLAAFLRSAGRTWWKPTDSRMTAEVEEFFAGNAAGNTLDGLRAVCMVRFGANLTPSRSVLHRYIQSLRLRTAGPASLAKDGEAMHWLQAAAGQMTLSELADGMTAAFGRERARSRSEIGRQLARMPDRPKLADRQILGTRPDVAAWLDEHRGSATLDKLAEACLAEFGGDQAPSRSTIHRYLIRTRKGRS